MLKHSEPIFYGRLIKRYQRFLMDVILDDGTTITAHTPNTGSMHGLLAEGNRVMLSKSSDEKRKYAFTTQAIEVDRSWVGINTHAPNKLIMASLAHPLLRDVQHYKNVIAEKRYGPELRSRVDLFFDESVKNAPPLYLEIKNVTMKLGDSAQFPDAVSSRALKHVHDLLFTIEQGFCAALWFIVQRQDCAEFRAAKHIDPLYANEVLRAQHAGLRIRALAARSDENGLELTHELPCIID